MLKESVTRCTLIEVSRMGQISDDRAFDGYETTNFNGDNHWNCFRTVLDFFKMDFDNRYLCLIIDNASNNIIVAKIPKLPHLGCCSHKLNIEVNAMVDRHLGLRIAIDSVGETMACAKSKLNNAAIVRNMT